MLLSQFFLPPCTMSSGKAKRARKDGPSSSSSSSSAAAAPRSPAELNELRSIVRNFAPALPTEVRLQAPFPAPRPLEPREYGPFHELRTDQGRHSYGNPMYDFPFKLSDPATYTQRYLNMMSDRYPRPEFGAVRRRHEVASIAADDVASMSNAALRKAREALRRRAYPPSLDATYRHVVATEMHALDREIGYRNILKRDRDYARSLLAALEAPQDDGVHNLQTAAAARVQARVMNDKGRIRPAVPPVVALPASTGKGPGDTFTGLPRDVIVRHVLPFVARPASYNRFALDPDLLAERQADDNDRALLNMSARDRAALDKIGMRY